MKKYLKKAASAVVLFFVTMVILIYIGVIGKIVHNSGVRVQLHDIKLDYNVKWNDTLDESLSARYQTSATTFISVEAKRHPATGANICLTPNEDTFYAFFKDEIVSYDLKQHTMENVSEADIKTTLHYFGRFEIGEFRDNLHEGKINFLRAPDTGTGPKDPCKLN